MISKRKLVSIGGWCGPALILGKLGLRYEAYPFDFSRVTLDGVCHFINNGFSHGFYPPGPPPYRPECVGIWVLFRGQHTAFAHFDLNDKSVQDGLNRKIERWECLLDSTDGQPVTFFRSVSARNPIEELSIIQLFNESVKKRNPNLDFRTVVSVHDQGFVWDAAEKETENIRSSTKALFRPNAATPFHKMDDRTSLWAVGYTESDQKTLFDRSQAGYGQIVTASLDESNWPPPDPQAMIGTDSVEHIHRLRYTADGRIAVGDALYNDSGDSISQEGKYEANDHYVDIEGVPLSQLRWESFPWRSHNNIALIDGIASVGGTCTGIGSTSYTSATTKTFLESSSGEVSDSAGVAANRTTTTSGENDREERVLVYEGRCSFCGSTDYHKAGKPFKSGRPFTSEDDELLLVHLYKILTKQSDKVEAVEQLANEMDRGAFEVICRIQFLTNNSTKITEGIDVS
eukprot:Tbor_TRINITY_DN3211_c0_g1::TRINITY_DN3211_c0_g1_i1::g.23819::m.23819